MPRTLTAAYGANVSGKDAAFRVWAPAASEVRLRVSSGGREREMAMERDGEGNFSALTAARPGDRYFYIVGGSKAVPDPVSRYLPEGVHGRTEIVDPAAFKWTDQHWRGLSLDEYVLYELHVGTFSPEGTFHGVIERLNYLKNLGITVLELMPVAAFPGTRNWGYDGVSPYAVQSSYGGPEGLKQLINAAHAAGLAVVLDVVYNHLGNEGNYLRLFGPYFTDRHRTPWGEAINYDGPGANGVRRYFVENALYWIREYHLDGLRLDAVQTIHDESPTHILAEIGAAVQSLDGELGRSVCVIAEDDRNLPSVVLPPPQGHGLAALWSDDFHHAAHAFFTGERQAYYQDFGRPEQILKALNDGFVFQGEQFHFWNAPRGAPPTGMRPPQHVICIQNHDQVGNRARGERLSELAPLGVRKLLAALLLLAPHTPLLFMGQEYDERAPFQFFTSYGDPALQKAVREGRRREFPQFRDADVPDPEDPRTFERSRLNWELALRRDNQMLRWYRELLAIRRKYVLDTDRTCHAQLREGILVMDLPANEPELRVVAALEKGKGWETVTGWRETISSDDDGYSVRIYERSPEH